MRLVSFLDFGGRVEFIPVNFSASSQLLSNHYDPDQAPDVSFLIEGGRCRARVRSYGGRLLAIILKGWLGHGLRSSL